MGADSVRRVEATRQERAADRGTAGVPRGAPADSQGLASQPSHETRFPDLGSELDTDDEDALLQPGMVVDGFRVVRLFGRGGMGRVYLARDSKLGRKVALKVLRRETMGSAEAVERFLFEARTTARFSHPNIVTIYAVGEVQGHPYVALEFLEGQSLRSRIRHERPGLKEALRICLAVISALEEAHKRGILHRDLKPENVMIPRDGRVRVVDFGLAKLVAHSRASSGLLSSAESSEPAEPAPLGFDSEAAGVRGTPMYMAPEQWRQGPLSPATDIWSLGLLAFELLEGAHPLAGADQYQVCYTVAESQTPMPPLTVPLPPLLRDTVVRCLEKQPDRRPKLEEIREAFEFVLAENRPRLDEDRSPFPGLLPLDERYADHFFGRDAEIGAFLERLRVEPVLPVVGPSGAGKSSFVQAGVIPRLREQGRWSVLRLRPGRNPVRSLAARMLAGSESPGSSDFSRTPWSDSGTDTAAETDEGQSWSSGDLDAAEEELLRELSESPASLALRLTELAERERSWVLLFVDQLEELCSLAADDPQRRLFMDAICLSADDPQIPVRTVFTLRDDFLGRLADGPAARERLGRVAVLRTPGAEALEEILHGTAASVGYAYDDEALAARMVADVGGEQAALPLLQFAGQMLWRHRDRTHRLLRSEIYDRMGGVAGALTLHTDEVLGGLSSEQLRLARALLVRLVSLDNTRRILPRTQLVDGLAAGADELVDRLIRERVLLVRKGSAVSDEPEIELVHESLIHSWDRLSRWIEAGREEIAFLDEVSQASVLWDSRGRRPDELWAGEALADAQRHLSRCSEPPTELVRSFLESGATRQRHRGRRLRMAVVGVFIALTTVSLVLVMLTIQSRKKGAESEARRIDAVEKRAQAVAETARLALVRGDHLTARSAVRRTLELRDSQPARAMWWQLDNSPVQWSHQLDTRLLDVDFGADGRTIAVVGETPTVYVVDATDGNVRRLRGRNDEDTTVAVTVSPDSTQLATASFKGEIDIWNLVDGSMRALPEVHSGTVVDLRFSPDGTRLASAGRATSILVWDVQTGARLAAMYGHEHHVRGVDFSPDGQLIVSCSTDTTVRLWDAEQYLPLRVLEGHTDEVAAVRFSPDGQRVASVGNDDTVRLWDVATGEQIRVMEGHEGDVRSVAFSADGSLLASASRDHTVRLWDVETGEDLRVLRAHEGWVTGVAFSQGSPHLASVGADSTIVLWRDAAAGGRAGLPLPRGHLSQATSACFSPDDKFVVSSGWMDRSIRVWERRSGRLVRTLASSGDEVTAVACSPDGKQIASGSAEGSLRLWDLHSGELTRTLGGHRSLIRNLHYDSGGRFLVSASDDRTAAVWDVTTGARAVELPPHSDGVSEAVFSHDGTQIATACDDGSVLLWDRATGTTLWEENVMARQRGIAFMPEDDALVSAGNLMVRWWNRRSGESLVVGTSPTRIFDIDIHPHEPLAAIVGASALARIDNLTKGYSWVLAGHRGHVNSVAFSTSGGYLVTAGQDGAVRVWTNDGLEEYWRTTVLLAETGEIHTHRGWESMSDGEPTNPSPSAWRDSISAAGQRAAVSSEYGLACIATSERNRYSARVQVQLWDTRTDRPLLAHGVDQIAELVVVPDGCLARTHRGDVFLIRRSGESLTLNNDGAAVSWTGQRADILTGSGDVISYSLDGKMEIQRDAGDGATAFTVIDGQLVAGYQDGVIAAVGEFGEILLTYPHLMELPTSAVEALRPGPRDTLIAGFVNGIVGIWSLSDGASLYQTRLHGPVAHIELVDDQLYIATELGDTATLSVGFLERDRCDLLNEVWNDAPVTWDGGRILEQPPPADHPCLEAIR
jgi:WD40 repeat protein/serine/threonine protein kinase